MTVTIKTGDITRTCDNVHIEYFKDTFVDTIYTAKHNADVSIIFYPDTRMASVTEARHDGKYYCYFIDNIKSVMCYPEDSVYYGNIGNIGSFYQHNNVSIPQHLKNNSEGLYKKFVKDLKETDAYREAKKQFDSDKDYNAVVFGWDSHVTWATTHKNPREVIVLDKRGDCECHKD